MEPFFVSVQVSLLFEVLDLEILSTQATVPVLSIPCSKVTSISCSSTDSLFPLKITYLYLGIHTHILVISSIFISVPTAEFKYSLLVFVPVSLTVTAFAHI